MKPMQWITGKVLVLSLLASSAMSAANTQDAQSLLAKMSDSAQSLSYQGEFVYQQGGHLETLSVIHRAAEQSRPQSERILYLDGAPREVIRAGNELFLSHHNGGVTQLQHGPLVPMLDRFQSGVSGDHYDVRIVGIDRVAGRETYLLVVVPKDKFRHGYQLWLDRQSSLLLKSELIDSQGMIIERLQFTSLDIGPLSDDAQSHLEQRPNEVDSNVVVNNQSNPAQAPMSWEAGWLPEGFELHSRAVRSSPVSEHAVDALTFSDGVASFTVFVEPDETGLLSQASEKIGALSAVAKIYREGDQYFHVTVMGDIPLGTAERVAVSVRPVKTAS